MKVAWSMQIWCWAHKQPAGDCTDWQRVNTCNYESPRTQTVLKRVMTPWIDADKANELCDMLRENTDANT